MNWKARFRNPNFIASLVLSVILPIVAYGGITAQDITTWSALIDLIKSAIMNPYLLSLVVVSVYNAVVDFSTPGISDKVGDR